MYAKDAAMLLYLPLLLNVVSVKDMELLEVLGQYVKDVKDVVGHLE
jgi:hypothetical protein